MAIWGKKSKSAETASAGLGAKIPAVEPTPKANLGAKTNGAGPGAPAAPTISPQLSQQRAGESKRLLMSFGEVVSVLMRSPQFKTMPLGQLEALVVPALVSGQFIVAEAQAQDSGFITPVGVALWATVSETVDRRLSEKPQEPIQLALKEWKSGTIPWLVALAGDKRVVFPMLKKLQAALLQGRPLKVIAKGKNGTLEVRTLDAKAMTKP